MSKKREGLSVTDDLSDLFREPRAVATDTKSDAVLTVQQALSTVLKQMTTLGNRPRTMSDYETHVSHFAETIGITYLHDITTESLIAWLASMDVSNATKLTRIKCMKAFLGRCFNNGWLSHNFWREINVKVDTPIKKGATERDIYTLMSLLDMSSFVELRDATAALLMFQTGVRISTLAQLTESDFDLTNGILTVDGSNMKAREPIQLPFDERLQRLLTVLIAQNNVIRREKKERNGFIFITQHGRNINATATNNTIRKRLKKYEQEFGLAHLNPHAIRRGFAKRLLDKGANITFIAKALGHSSTEVTSRYLYLDKVEVANELRKYL